MDDAHVPGEVTKHKFRHREAQQHHLTAFQNKVLKRIRATVEVAADLNGLGEGESWEGEFYMFKKGGTLTLLSRFQHNKEGCIK